VVTQIRDQLRRAIRLQSGRCPNPVMMIIDSQSVKGSETVGKASRGYDPARRSTGGSVVSWWMAGGCCWR
jgi:hypothetical protein